MRAGIFLAYWPWLSPSELIDSMALATTPGARVVRTLAEATR